MKLEAAITGFARQQAADGRSGHTRAAYRAGSSRVRRLVGRECRSFCRSLPTIWPDSWSPTQVLLTP